MSSSSSAALARCPEEPRVSTSAWWLLSLGQRSLPCCLILIALVLVFYNPVTRNEFVSYDDDAYITENAPVRAGLTWATVKWAFATDYDDNWHPLTWLSHALDCELFGLSPVGHHYVNVLLHAANAVLLFLLLQGATGLRWRSLIVAALFALHPVNVESVAWAAELKNVLSMLFLLLALHAYVWYAHRPRVGRYVVVILVFTLGLLSKPQVITLPFLLLLFDYWPLHRVGARAATGITVDDGSVPRFPGRWLVFEKVPLLLLSAASAVVTMKAQNAGGAIQPFSQYGPLLRLETAAIAYVRYLGNALWPSKLVALYPHPTKFYPAWHVGMAVLGLMLITVSVVRARNRRYLVVGWFWFLGSLVPMIGLVQVGSQAMADRYAYLPFVGLFLMSTWLVADWAKARQVGTKWIAIAAVSCLLVLGSLTYHQIGYWHDTTSFWQRTLALTQDNYVAEDNLGAFLGRQGRLDEAAVHFRAALAIRPDDLTTNMNLGAYEHGRGNLPGSIERYQIVARYAASVPNAVAVDLSATAYDNLGSLYRETGDSTKAKQYFEVALQLEPARTTAMIGSGLVAQKNGDMAEALRQYTHAMSLQPTDVGYLLLAQALQREGRRDEAKAIYERVVRLSPNFAEAQKREEELLSGK
jgi:protein O-mannosyl-transferase